MNMTINQSRRDFLKISAAAGGGLMLEFCLPPAFAAATGKRIRSLPLKNHGITVA